MALFFELLQVSLNTRDSLSRTPSESEWFSLLREAKRQAVTGVMMSGLERLSEQVVVPEEIMVKWVGGTMEAKRRNGKMTAVCKMVCDQLERDGFDVCVLKGQANHTYYPEDIGMRRSCGDVDVWVQLRKRNRHIKRTILSYLDRKWSLKSFCWLHASVEEDGIPVEVHFCPSFMNEPCHNRRFQRHFKIISECAVRKMVDGMVIPAMRVDEDVVYQMNHIYRHLIDEGIGLRQIVDFYFLLRAWNEQHTKSLDSMNKLISRLGMRRFAGALMYVLVIVCGIDRSLLLCEPSEKDGQFLLGEIMIAGNFGQDDPRLSTINRSGSVTRRQLSKGWRRFKRNLRFLTSYPGEVLFEPYTRMKHYLWKRFFFAG